MVAEHRLREEVVDELLRRVLVHRDLLEDDLALLVDLHERGREDHVRHDVERRLDVVVGDTREDDGVLARGRGVELGAHRVERLRDRLRVEAARALEEQVLDEVGDARAVVALVARADVDPEAERDGTHAGQALRDNALAAVELAQRDLLHPATSWALPAIWAATTPATTSRPSPARFASYSASSARRKSVCASSASAGHEAKPKLARETFERRSAVVPSSASIA